MEIEKTTRLYKQINLHIKPEVFELWQTLPRGYKVKIVSQAIRLAATGQWDGQTRFKMAPEDMESVELIVRKVIAELKKEVRKYDSENL